MATNAISWTQNHEWVLELSEPMDIERNHMTYEEKAFWPTSIGVEFLAHPLLHGFPWMKNKNVVMKHEQDLTRKATSDARSRDRDGPGDRNPTPAKATSHLSKIQRATTPVSDDDFG
ncbi:hypothetical protein PHMEG_00035732 [Phytophthora megakarya]|uniref:Uncharacterized protein n=1 Tax=Phytophthora megakarya TaxID=4795 RepID=A0A225UNG9_9STRA|nr:hypothetical protein PHMEG_00035732 [Phytophthora megakarya]